MRRPSAIRLGALLLLALALLGSNFAWGERARKGDLEVFLDGGLSPKELPRNRPAPVGVFLAGGVETVGGAPLPRVNWIRLELAWRGKLDTKGLAVCPRARLRGTDSQQAVEVCGPALVGHGKLYAKIFVPNQPPFGLNARLLAFNGETKTGRPAVWVHAYAPDPPVSFVLPFEVRHQPGAFRTVLVTTIRKSVGPWPHVANFRITVGRQFKYRGERHSYMNASCPVPPHWTEGFLSLARATYTFADGRKLHPQVSRRCKAR
jgi:hypothetical protein